MLSAATYVLASTSSTYGANEDMPKKHTKQIIKCHFMRLPRNQQNMAHSYSHLFNLPITMFGFLQSMGLGAARYGII